MEVTIVENDTPTLSVSDQRAGEASGQMVFTVTLSQASSAEVMVDYASADGTAEAGTDYTEATGTLTFAAQTTAAQEIRVAIAGDKVDEEDETFTVTLSGAANATLAGGGTMLSATGTIEDDDERGVTVSPTELRVTEGGSDGYTVVLSSKPTGEVTVAVSVPAGAEFTVDEEELTFGAGDWATAQTVTVTADRDDDAVAASAASIEHEVSGGDYAGEAAAEVAVTVVEADTARAELTLEYEAPEHSDADDDGEVTLGDELSYEARARNSGNVPLKNVTVSDERVGGAAKTCATLGIGESCLWSGSYGVTQADVDAGEVKNTVTATADEVADQEASQSTTVAQERELTLEKTATEQSFGEVGETIGYTYTVSNSGTVTLAGTVTIADDKIASGITCEAVPVDGLGPGGTVTCTGSYTTVQADVDGSEVVNKATATLAGVQSSEATEQVTWRAPQAGQPTVELGVGAVSVVEAVGSLSFGVRLSAASQQTVTVEYETADATATAGSDYTAAAADSVLTFTAGTTEATIEVAIAADRLDEEDETFTVMLREPVNATLGAVATATATITDDDERGVTVIPTELRVTEGGSDGYTVVLRSQPTGEVTVAVTVPAGAEFTVDKTGLTFAVGAWETAQTVTVRAGRDNDAVAAAVASIEHEVSGGDYAGEAAAAVAVTVLEADTANAELTLEFGPPTNTDTDGNGDVTLGDDLSYEASARNSGNVPLMNVTVSDERTGGTAKICATLGIGQSCEWSGSYEVTQADVDAGKVDNTVTATADDAADRQASQSTTVAQERELTLEKTATEQSFGEVGETIGYTYTVSNSGTVTLAGTVTIADDKIASGITCEAVPVDGLGPGGTVTCTGSYTTTQADVDGSEVVNKATATLAGVQSSEATEQVTWRAPQAGQPTVELGVGAVSVVEAAGSLSFGVRLSAASQQTVTVAYETADATATAGSDYTAAAADSVLTFTAGTTEATIEVAIAADRLDEEDETFTVMLREPVNATLGAVATATATIVDDDERGVTVSPTELEVTEGGSDGYTVVLGSQPTGDVTVAVSVPAGTDVSVDEDSLTFTSSTWDVAQTVTVRAAEDDDALTDDAVELTHEVTGGDYGTNGVSAEPVAVTIVENDTPTLSVSDQRAGEASGQMVFTVTLSQASSAEVMVDYASADGTAEAGTDYTEATGTLTFAAQTTAAQEIRVAIAGDKVDEEDETFTVTLSGAVNATLAGGEPTLSVTGTITDDDETASTAVTLSVDPAAVAEEGAGREVTLTGTLDQAPRAQATAVTVSVAGDTATAAADFVAVADFELTIAAGERSGTGTFTLVPVDDEVDEADETVTVSGAAPGTDLSVTETQVTITDNDTRGVTVKPTELELTEGDSATYKVVLGSKPTDTVTVRMAVSGDDDMTVSPESLTFMTGTWAEAQTITVTAGPNVDGGGPPTRLTHQVSGADYEGMPADPVTVTISDDDTEPGPEPGPEPELTIADAHGLESAGVLEFVVELSAESGRQVTVNYATEAGTATEGADYTRTVGALTFEPGGALRHTIAVPIVNDTLDEAATETFTVAISGALNATAGAAATGTILDDDAVPELTIADVRAVESTGMMEFTVRLGAPSGRQVAVTCFSEDGTATAGDDYVPELGTLVLEPGQTTGVISVPILDDLLDEEDETLTMVLSDPVNATLADGTATGTILDDDASVAGMWLSRFGRTVATHELAAIGERLSGQLGRGAQVTIAGQRLEHGDGGVAAGEPDLFAPSPVRTMDVPELMQGSSFLLTGTDGDESAADTGSGTGARWSAWGSGEATQLAGKDREVSLQGRVVTATVGADYERGPIVAGVAVSYSAGAGEFTVPAMDERPGRQINVDSSLASVLPYVGVAANERLAFWGMLGYGRGRMAMGGGDVETGIEMKMGAFGASGALLVPAGGAGLGLDLKSDGFLVLMTSKPTADLPVVEADASRVRLVLDGSLGVPLGVAGVLTPSLEVGVRHDGGDAETGTGLEVGGGVRYVYPAWGLTLAANGRVLVTHRDRGYDEWGAGGSLRVDPGAPGRGLALDVNSSWGTAASGVARLWALPDASELVAGERVVAAGTAGRLDAEVGYGVGAGDAVVTPYAGFTLTDGGDRAYRLGSRVSLGSFVSLSLEADRRDLAGVYDVTPDMGVTLSGTVRW